MGRKDSELIELIQILTAEFRAKGLQAIKNRRIPPPSVPSKITALIGMRRSGKSFFQFQLIRDLRTKIPGEQIFYMNFEDDRLLPMDGKELGRLVDLFYQLFPENHRHKVYFFFDEIQ